MDPATLNPSVAPVNHNHPPRIHSYSEEEWNRMKGTIQSFYIHGRYTLPKLMKKLADEYDFHATVKMYKTHFTRWRFDKNITEKRLDNASSLPSQRLKKYLYRRGRKPLSSAHGSISGLMTDATPSSPLTNAGSNHGVYENLCPYRLFDKKYRFFEEFSDGAVYSADSFGYREYIELGEERPCTGHCWCRLHRPTSSSGYAFVVHKHINGLKVTIQSDSLFAEINKCIPPEGLSTPEQSRSLDGFTLLQHHATLKRHLLQVFRDSAQDVVHELRLLVDGLLGDGQVFQSFGYETLHERGHLDYELWSTFQQQRIDSDIDDLDAAFSDGGDFDVSLPTANSYVSQETQLQAGSSISAPNVENDLSYAARGSHPIQDCTQSFTFRSTIRVEDIAMSANTSGGTQNSVRHTISDFRNKIRKAAHLGDAKTTQSLINMNRSVITKDPMALILAEKFKHLKTVQILLDAGADVNDWRVVRSALISGNPYIVQMLVDAGADLNQEGALINAIAWGNPYIVQMLLNDGADPNQEGALRNAIASRNLEMARVLLNAGADVNRPGILECAVKSKNPEILRIFFDAGADANRPGILECAIRSRSLNIIRMLLDIGADVNQRGAFEEAAKSGSLAMVWIFLNAGADPNQWGVLRSALESGNPEVVRMLIDAGADVNQPSAIQGAAQPRNPKIVQILFEAVVDAHHLGVLGRALESANPEVVRMLLGAGVDGNQRSVEEVAEPGSPKIVQQLLGNLYEQSAQLLTAVIYGRTLEVQKLLKDGADVNAFSKLGSALNISVSQGNEDIVRCLLEHGADVQLAALHVHAWQQHTGSVRAFLRKVWRVQNGKGLHHNNENVQRLRQRFWFQNYRHAWDVGITALRDLSHGRAPPGIRNTLAFLLLSRAITEVLKEKEGWDYTHSFDHDLSRWQAHFEETADIEAYRDAVRLMWNIDLAEMIAIDVPCSTTVESLGELARMLIGRTREMLDLDLSDGNRLDQSQRRWRERNASVPTAEPESPAPQDTSWEAGPPSTPVKPPDLYPPLEEPPGDPGVVCLVIGAIFVVVLIFLQARDASSQSHFAQSTH